MMYRITVMVKNSQNTVPMATMETRSVSFAYAFRELVESEGFTALWSEVHGDPRINQQIGDFN